jgi:RimJ/RimL family protein N-acetyltransferase
MIVPTLTTERLLLRAFRQSDLDAFAAMQADEEVMRHLSVGASAGKPRTRIETWANMAQLMGQWALKGYGSFAVEERATGRFIGRAGILHPEGWAEPELAYALAREAWHRGYAEEACRTILHWAFGATGAERIVSYIKPGNTPSARLAARLGAVNEGMGEVMGVPCEVWVHRPVPSALA